MTGSSGSATPTRPGSRFHVERLAELGPALDEPHTRQLDGKLREIRFCLAGRPTRVTSWIAPGRRIIC